MVKLMKMSVHNAYVVTCDYIWYIHIKHIHTYIYTYMVNV